MKKQIKYKCECECACVHVCVRLNHRCLTFIAMKQTLNLRLEYFCWFLSLFSQVPNFELPCWVYGGNFWLFEKARWIQRTAVCIICDKQK